MNENAKAKIDYRLSVIEQEQKKMREAQNRGRLGYAPGTAPK